MLEVLEGRYALAAMLPGFDANTLARNDDGSTGAVNLGFEINFLGTTTSQLFVNNNGNVTFGSGSSQFTPSALTNAGQLPRIAPFFADVDTRAAGSAEVTYGTGTVNYGTDENPEIHAAFGVNWDGVGYFSNRDDKLNKFQLLIINREDLTPGVDNDNFDIQFNYDQLQWETGNSNGFGGTNARMGFTNGSGLAGTYFELSGISKSFLDSSISTGLIHNRFNSDVAGRFVFFVREGQVLSAPLTDNLTVSGAINADNPTNDWNFFGNAGRSVTINVHTGSASSEPRPLSPAINFAQVQLLDSQDNVLATATNDPPGDAEDRFGGDVSIAGFTFPASGNYKIRVSAGPDHPTAQGNYTILKGDATVNNFSAVINQPNTGQLYSQFAVDRWSFTGLAGQQVQFNLLNSQAPTGILFDLAGPDGVTLFTNLSASSDILTLPTTGPYLLTAHSSNGQSGAYAFSLNLVNVTELTLGQAFNGQLLGSGQLQLFKFNVTDANPVLIRLDDVNNSDTSEVYVRRGAAPTRGTFDFRSTAVAADQNVQIPLATPGTWFVLVYAREVPQPSNFSLLASSSAIFLNSLTPDRAATNSTTDLTLSGSGFVPGSTVQLLRANNTVAATAQSVLINSFSQLTATFNLAGVAIGSYGVRVTLPNNGSSATLPGAFQVLAAGQARLETNVIVPGALGRHGLATLYVEYANTGNVAMPAPILTLQSADPDDSDRPLLTLSPTTLAQGFWTSATPEGFSHSVQIYASGAVPGVLQPGERTRVPVYYTGLQQPWDFGDNQVEFEIRVHEAGSTDIIDWAALKNEMRPATISADAWDAIFDNLVAQTGNTFGEYVAMLNRNAVYLGRLGLNVTDVSELFAFQSRQAAGLSPADTLVSAIDASVAAPGFDLLFSRTFGNSIESHYQSGPFGRGWTAPWQISLVERTDGTVEIHESADAVRIYQPDSRTNNRYFSQPGDAAVLRKVAGGAFELTQTNGQVMRFRADGSFEFVQDINGNRITTVFTSGRLTNLTHTSGASIDITYNGDGLIDSLTSHATATDIPGRTTTYTYDADRHLLSATGPAGTTNYTYDTSSDLARKHALLSITGPSGITRSYVYDDFGRLSSTSLTGNAERVDYTYEIGAVTSTNATGVSSRLFFDHQGLVVRSEDGLGNYQRLEYNDQRQLVRVTDTLGQAVDYTRCSCGRPTSITDQLGNTTRFTLGGPNNDPRSMTDANGQATQYAYDARGNQNATTYADGSVEQAVFNAQGSAISLVNRRGQTITITRNAAGQVTSETFPGNLTNTYTYDARGRLATAVDSRGTTTFTYDNADRLTRADYPGGRFITYTYDAGGRRLSMVDSSGFEVRYTYDAVGRLSELKDGSDARLVLYTYDAAGRLIREDKGNGAFTLYTYDGANRLISIVNRANANTINSRFDYTFDALGRRTSLATLDGKWTYTYDVTGQLTRAVFKNLAQVVTQDLRYEYDALGNRIRTVENGVTTNYSTNNLNEYTSVGGTNHTYDADGNLTSDGTRTYAYNARNQLVQVISGGVTWQYEYDAFGNRVATIENGQRTDYLLDMLGSTSIVGTFDNGGARTASYAIGLGLEAAVVGGDTGFYDFDALGSTAGISGGTGAYTSSYAYAPFGETLASNESFANPFQFVGASGVMQENNGLDFMRARFYTNDLGRFTSVDPLRLGGGDVNFYRYSANDPVNRIDPSGQASLFTGISGGLGISLTTGLTFNDDCTMYATFGGGATTGGIVFASLSSGSASQGLSSEASVTGGKAGIGITGHGGFSDSSDSPQGAISLDVGLGVPGASTNLFYNLFIGYWCDPNKPKPKPPKPPGNSGGDGGGGIAQSQDPNEIIGPAGEGPLNLVPASVAFPYRINFENFSGASAPAQRVVVTNVLSPSFDLNTFQFTDFGFGGDEHINIVAPPNSQHFETTVVMTYEGTTFNVNITGDLDVPSRTVTVTYQSLELGSFLPPPVLIGFLPPEDGTGRGLGHVSYLVRPVAGIAQGTEVRNIALIKFDSNEIIATNQVDEHDPSLGTDPNKEALVTIGAPSLTLRKNGLEVELVNDEGTVLHHQLLTSTAPIVVNGPANEPGNFVLDYAFGGLFTVLGGITYNGNGSGHDRIVVKGDAKSVTLASDKVTVAGTGKKPTLFNNVDKASLIGGAGKNTLNASKFTGKVTFDGREGNDSLTGGSGDDTFIVGAGKDSIKGNLGTDTVIANFDGIATLTKSKLTLGAIKHSLSKIENLELTGGDGNDVFIVTGWTGSAVLKGGGGTDKIVSVNKANFTLSDNLLTRSTGGTFTLSSIESAELTGGSKADIIDASAFSGFTYLNGLGGNDILKGGKGGSILLGASGNDSITGNIGRDLLFGGGGTDALVGGLGEDVLIGRPTSFESKHVTLDALFAFWNRNDLNYQQRIDQFAAGIPGLPTLNPKFLKKDKLTDTLTGGGDLDWFFALGTEVADLVAPELLTTLP